MLQIVFVRFLFKKFKSQIDHYFNKIFVERTRRIKMYCIFINGINSYLWFVILNLNSFNVFIKHYMENYMSVLSLITHSQTTGGFKSNFVHFNIFP